MTKCDKSYVFYFEMRQFCYNMLQLFQNAAVVTKWVVYYKMCRWTVIFELLEKRRPNK